MEEAIETGLCRLHLALVSFSLMSSVNMVPSLFPSSTMFAPRRQPAMDLTFEITSQIISFSFKLCVSGYVVQAMKI